MDELQENKLPTKGSFTISYETNSRPSQSMEADMI